MEEIDFPVLHPLESVVSPVVKCRPGGTVFHKPCTLSFPHNAVNEKFWKFTLLVKNRIEDKWRQISLKSDEKDITFTVCKGRCYVTLNHFCQYVAVGHPADVNYMAKRKMKLLVFRKRITNFKYELQIRLCNPGDIRKITEEHEQHEGKLLQTPVDILCLNKNMIITVESNSDEWRIMEQEKKINAEYIWHATPQKSFQLTRRNLSENLLNVTVSPSQAGNEIDPVNVNCELENPILCQMRSFWKLLQEHWWIVTVFLFGLLAIAAVLIICFAKEPLIIGLGLSVLTAGVSGIWYVHRKMTPPSAGRQQIEAV
ncbi:UNC5C-like protein [Antedon mediterranea]|uniref:UNC5C-like protein n=1 Tax=Antedon mediterranea TaxID=105859 RepID=UPI003AF94179